MSAPEIKIVNHPPKQAVVIRKVVSTIKLGKVMGPAYHLIKETLDKQNAPRTDEDVPFCIYNNVSYDHLDDKGLIALFRMLFVEKWDVEMGITTTKPVSVNGEMTATTIFDDTYLSTIHEGPYRNLRQTYKRLSSYATENNLVLKNTSIERYLNSPIEVPDTALKTNVLVAIQKP